MSFVLLHFRHRRNCQFRRECNGVLQWRCVSFYWNKKYVPSLKRKKRFHTGRKQIFLEDDISLAQKTKGKIVSKEKFGLSKSIGGASLELNPRNSRRDAIILCSMEHRRDPVILFGFWTFNELSVVDGYCLVSFSKVCFEFSHTWKWIQILLIEAWNKPTIQ